MLKIDTKKQWHYILNAVLEHKDTLQNLIKDSKSKAHTKDSGFF